MIANQSHASGQETLYTTAAAEKMSTPASTNSKSPSPRAVEQAHATALIDKYAVRRRSVPTYRGGLAPRRLRRVVELVHARMEDELTLHEMAESVELSIAHFSQMFHKSTGETPHQFVLRQRVEHAKQMLAAAESRVLDVAVACGFKTQQHFARVFRRVCGASPTEYRQGLRARSDLRCEGFKSIMVSVFPESNRKDSPHTRATGT